VDFNTEDFNVGGLHDNVTANSRFTIPVTDKITECWLIHAHITWAANAAGGRELDILNNGTVISSTHTLGSNDQQSQDATILINDPRVNPQQYFEVQVTQTSGGALNLLTEPEHTYFEIIHLW
jgi:hypothetical protein